MYKDLEKELEEAYKIIEWYANRKHITGTQADSLDFSITELCFGSSIPDDTPDLRIEMGQKAREFLVSKGRMKDTNKAEEFFNTMKDIFNRKEIN